LEWRGLVAFYSLMVSLFDFVSPTANKVRNGFIIMTQYLLQINVPVPGFTGMIPVTIRILDYKSKSSGGDPFY
jgi:hypothetical protein